MQCHRRLTTNNNSNSAQEVEDAEGRRTFEYRLHRVGLPLKLLNGNKLRSISYKCGASRSFSNGQRVGERINQLLLILYWKGIRSGIDWETNRRQTDWQRVSQLLHNRTCAVRRTLYRLARHQHYLSWIKEPKWSRNNSINLNSWFRVQWSPVIDRERDKLIWKWRIVCPTPTACLAGWLLVTDIWQTLTHTNTHLRTMVLSGWIFNQSDRLTCNWF